VINSENRDLVFSIMTKIQDRPIWFDTHDKICQTLRLCKGCYQSCFWSEYCQECYDSIMKEVQ
jgi:hypothetical protein